MCFCEKKKPSNTFTCVKCDTVGCHRISAGYTTLLTKFIDTLSVVADNIIYLVCGRRQYHRNTDTNVLLLQ